MCPAGPVLPSSHPSETVTGSLVATGSPSSHLTFRKKAMSAVSSESPRAAANLSEPSSSQPAATVSADRPPAPPGSGGTGRANGAGHANADFGANEWLVDELYQRYLADPGSVDRVWWNFFADYHPEPVEPSPVSPSPLTAT